MDIMTHAKFYFNRLMLTLIFGAWASEPPPPPWAWTGKAGLIGLIYTLGGNLGLQTIVLWTAYSFISHCLFSRDIYFVILLSAAGILSLKIPFFFVV